MSLRTKRKAKRARAQKRRPKTSERAGYQAQRERATLRSRLGVQAASDVGAMPKVKNPARKEACRLDLLRFLTSYFPTTTGLSAFSDDHVRVIRRIERCILHGGRFVNAVYRGFAKTTIGENTTIWATFYGHRRFVPIFGADADSAAGNIDSIKYELEENDLLFEDFPEVCHPIRCLEGAPQRAAKQFYREPGACPRCKGKGKVGQTECLECGGDGAAKVLTRIEWTSDRVMLPTIPGSPASGAVICARGITGGFRGLKVKLPDGTQQRPDFIIGDDLQTDESASMPGQVQKTLRTLRKGVVKLGGHRRQLAIVINATVIEPDDAIDQLLSDPAWQGERIPLVRKWPDAHATFWLKDYAEARRDYDRNDIDAQAEAHARATELYRQRRKEADAGAVVSWENCYDPETEISAVQHAYNALIDDGEEAFASEYQVRPLARDHGDDDEVVTTAFVMRKLSGVDRGIVPQLATRLTAGIDVQQTLLYWVVCAWEENFSGYVLDYGAWPDQRRAYFTLADARITLAAATKTASLEGSIFQGLTGLAQHILARNWEREDGSPMRVQRCLIDANWQPSAEVIHQFCRNSDFASVVMPSHGVATTATRDPYTHYKRKQGERVGANWRIPSTKGTRLARHVIMDPNHWKTFLYSRLAVQLGDPGSLTLFGKEAKAHQMFADHLVSEYRQRVENKTTRRSVDIWDLRPGRPDNHLLDCLYASAVAASIEGVTLDEVQRIKMAKKDRIPLAEKQRRAMATR